MTKYHNQKTTAFGRAFDSKREADRYFVLRLYERAGKISDLRCQVPFELVPAQVSPEGKKVNPVRYIADFTYTKDGKLHVEDAKGMQTDVYKIKKKLMLQVHGVWVREV